MRIHTCSCGRADVLPPLRLDGSPVKEVAAAVPHGWGDHPLTSAAVHLTSQQHPAALEKGGLQAPVLQGVMRCAAAVGETGSYMCLPFSTL